MKITTRLLPWTLYFFLICQGFCQNVQEHLDTSECGKTKGCWRSPDGCAPDHCDHFLMWQDKGKHVEFEIEAKADSTSADAPWTAVGFSQNKKMANTSVVDCIYNESSIKVFIQASYNEKHGHTNEVLKNRQLGLLSSPQSGSYNNDVLYCKFAHVKEVNQSDKEADKVSNLSLTHYLFLATGPTDGLGKKNYHDKTPAISPHKINLTEPLNIGVHHPNTSTNSSTLDDSDCGKTKGCIRTPDHCQPHDCQHILSWKNDGDSVIFEIQANITENIHVAPWTAVGFSKDMFMPNTSVVDCIVNGSKVIVQASYNADHHNEPLKNRYLGLNETASEGIFKNRVLYCKFQREKSINKSEPEASEVFDLDMPYHLILGTGPTDGKGVKDKHKTTPIISPYKMNLSVNANMDFEHTSIDTSECGKSKGCWRDPGGCISDTCQHLLTWSDQGDHVMFEIQSKITSDKDIKAPWTAVGFSNDTNMADTSVVDCIFNESTVLIQASYNKKGEHENTVLNNPHLGLLASNQSGSYHNNVLYCKFAHVKEVNQSDEEADKVSNLSLTHYLFLATGPTDGHGKKEHHDKTPAISPHKINLTEPLNIGVHHPNTSTNSSTLDDSDCGKTKGCIRNPDQCKPHECQHILSWKNDGDSVIFEIQADVTDITTAPWTAVGFSKDQVMADTSVVDCIFNGATSEVMIQSSYNIKVSAHENHVLHDRDLGLNLSASTGVLQDGLLYCQFVRYKSVNQSKVNPDTAEVFDLHDNYFLLLAAGPTDGKGVKHHHNHDPSISPHKINLTQYEDIGGNTDKKLLKVHACLMILCIMVLIGPAMMVARHLKPLLKGNVFLGSEVWFQTHRGCIILGYCGMVVSFIIIFVVHGGWVTTELAKIHAPVGIATMSLLTINIILALFRPDPDHPRRPYFKFAHRTIGLLAYAAAGVTMAIGSRLPKMGLPSWMIYLVVGFIVWQFFMDVTLLLTTRKLITDPKTSELGLNVGYQELSSDDGSPVAKVLLLMKVLMGAYMVGAIGIAAVLTFYVIKS